MWLARNGSSGLHLYPERRLCLFRLSSCPLSLSNAYSSRIVNFQNENMVAGITDTPAAFIKKSISPNLSFTRYNIRNVTSIVATHPFQKPPFVERFAEADFGAYWAKVCFARTADLGLSVHAARCHRCPVWGDCAAARHDRVNCRYSLQVLGSSFRKVNAVDQRSKHLTILVATDS